MRAAKNGVSVGAEAGGLRPAVMWNAAVVSVAMPCVCVCNFVHVFNFLMASVSTYCTVDISFDG